MTISRLLGLCAISVGLCVPSFSQAQNWKEISVSNGTKDDSDTDMATDTWLCSLSGSQGYFGDGEYLNGLFGHEFVEFVENSAGTEYVLRAGPEQTARGICTKWSNFQLPAGGGILRDEQSSLRIIDEQCWSSKVRDAWWGDSATMLVRMEGWFNKSSNFIRINQSSNPSTPSNLQIRLENGAGSVVGCFPSWLPADIGSKSKSVFVGNSNNHQLVKLIGFNGGVWTRGNITSPGVYTYVVSTESGFSSYWMAQTSGSTGGFCYLSQVNGDFNDSDDSIRIRERGNQWFVEVLKDGGAGVHGSARCMAYDQR